MTDYYAAAARCGRDMTVRSAQLPSGRSARGYIQPLDPEDTKKYGFAARPGRVDDERYLLIVGPGALVSGETGVTVSSGGRLYELLRAESVSVGGVVTHWEGVLRLKGGGQ